MRTDTTHDTSHDSGPAPAAATVAAGAPEDTAVAGTPDGTAPPGAGTRRGGPPLPIPIAAYAVLAIGATVTYSGAMPGSAPEAALAALSRNPFLAQVSAALLVAASAALAVFAAAATHRVQALGARVAGPRIGLAGGVLAAATLALSGLVGWVAVDAVRFGDAPLVGALGSLSFALGGVGFALCSALLIAGLAVPALFQRSMPRPLAIIGLVVAGCGALSPLALLWSALYPLLPVVRFGGLLWFVAASFALPLLSRSDARAQR